ncbi:MAG: hypothetical protein Q9169_006761 [Polycauliona sp. 2 TL-2023]
MTEDEIYRTSTQYRLWSFTPETLASLRATTNVTASNSVRAAAPGQQSEVQNEDTNGTSDAAPEVEVDCLTSEEEQKIISFYCLRTMEFVDFCEYPTNVKATAVQYLKRFYLTNSPMTYHPKEIMNTAVYLAMKAEDSFHSVRSFAEKLAVTTEDILAPEFLLTQGLRFTFDVRHPYHGLEGGFLELLAFTNGKGETSPAIEKSPEDIRDEMLEVPPKTKDVKELVARCQAAHGRAKEMLKTSALLTDAYFLYTPSQIWLAALFMVDEPLARFYLDTKLPTTSDMRPKLFTVLQQCAEMLRSAPATQPGKEEKKELKRIQKKLEKCRNREKLDLVKMNEAQKRDADRDGGNGLDENVVKKRKLEREQSMKESEDLFGPALGDKNG